EKVIAGKSKKLLKRLPKFIISYLKKIIHQDEINENLSRVKDLYGLDFVEEILYYFKVNIETVGFESIPSNGRFIFASNHPLGGFDGLVFMHTISRWNRNVKSISNDILMNLKNLRPVLIGVNKHGSNTREDVKTFTKFLEGDDPIMIFPAGLVSRKQKGVIRDLPWKKSFISMAVKYKRDVIPVHINGRNSNFFYNLARLRKFLRIKSNLEMLYLPDETFKQKNKNIKIIFGNPISYTFFDNSKKPKEWAKWVKARVYALPEEN
ncbi:1-acyl-sn-glycerol-3-phosphate acyltransferase, partial [Bacteroidota bacterium]